MNYRLLGKTGLSVSELGLGTWAMGSDWGNQSVKDSIATLHAALDSGINFIDTAAGYGSGRSEQVIAKALRSRSGATPVIATKIHPQMPGPWPPSPYCKLEERYPVDYLDKVLERSLKNLETERIDLLQFHTWTRAWNADPHVFDWVDQKKNQGKIGFIGVSTPEHDQHAVVDLMRAGLVDTVQIIFNLFEQEPAAQLLPEAQARGIGVIVRCALDEGSLAGSLREDRVFDPGDFRNRYFEGDRLTRTRKKVKSLQALVEKESYTLREAALRFVIDHPAVSTTLAGARTPEQALQNAQVADILAMESILHQKLRAFNWRKGFWYDGKH
jgi:aryl-alcohol dehydrogenase-like predicted oxidoreductase